MHTRFKYSVMERVVGIFMLSILVLLLSTVVLLGRGKNWFRKYNTYYTSFNASYNLKPGAAVKYLETDIGKVKAVSLVDNHVRIRLAILDLYASRIRTDVVAKVESPTFIGSEYIAILPGSVDSPLVPPGGELTSVARKSIGDYIEELEVEKTAKDLVVAVQRFSVFMDTINDPEGPFLQAIENLNKTAQHAAKIAGHVQAGEGTAGRMLYSSELMDAALGGLDKVDVILDQLAVASAKTPATMDILQENLAQLESVREEVAESIGLIRSLLEAFQANMPKIQRIIENAEKGSRDIPELTGSAVQGIYDAREELDNVNMIIQALKKNILIRSKLPPPPVVGNTETHLR
ncbi:MAG: MlaD family protein [Deltaproteobacteria bacterium]|nr:MlaD family protein [Deltaproteobacteria bacterium]